MVGGRVLAEVPKREDGDRGLSAGRGAGRRRPVREPPGGGTRGGEQDRGENGQPSSRSGVPGAGATAAVLPLRLESESRFRRFKSVLSSAALW